MKRGKAEVLGSSGFRRSVRCSAAALSLDELKCQLANLVEGLGAAGWAATMAAHMWPK